MNEVLERLISKYNFPKREIKPTVSIAEIENVIGFTLPADYKFYLEHYSFFEDFIGPEYFYLWDLDNLLHDNLECRILEKMPLMIGIGGNGSSEFLAIEKTFDGNCRIVISPFIDLDKQYNIEIGTSFTDFLIRLDAGREWFT